MLCCRDFVERRAGLTPRALFFGAAFLARTLRAGRGFRAADFFAELFFFVRFAIVCKRRLIDWRRKNGRLIKNISFGTQADSEKIGCFCHRTS